jgi:osmotically-inducible protein OsmY
MALSDFWRSNRGSNRDQPGHDERDRQSRHSGRYANDEQDEGFRRRGRREGSDYYGNNPERYGAGNYDSYGTGRYGGEEYGDSSAQNWRTSGDRYDRSEPRDRWASGDPDSSFNDRWQNSYGGSSRPSNFRGYGGYGGGDYGERGAYGGYGRSEFGSRDENRAQRESGSSEQGQFRGRGPKGYRRSDERIREDVCECLTDDERLDASNIDVTVKDCEVTLSGTVSSREDKRRAENLIDRLSGVKDIHNQLRVANETGQKGRTGSDDEGDESRQDIHH